MIQTLSRTLTALLVFIATANLALADEKNQEPRWFYATVGTGVDFNRGDFGEDITTNSASIPFFAKLEWEPVTLRVSVPLLYIEGSDQISGDGTEGSDADEAIVAAKSSRFGVGDIVTSLTYSYYPDRYSSLPIIDLIGQIRIPTSQPGNLGSRGTDLTFGTELAKTFGLFSIFGGASYRIKTAQDLDNIWLASGGASIKIVKWLRVGAAYDFRQASTPRATDSHEVSPYVSIRLSEHLRLTPYGLIGLSNSAPDWGLGTTVSYQF